MDFWMSSALFKRTGSSGERATPHDGEGHGGKAWMDWEQWQKDYMMGSGLVGLGAVAKGPHDGERPG